MASTIPLMPFLRPMAPPRPSTIRHFLRFSTSAKCLTAAETTPIQEDRNVTASRTADAAYPPSSMRSLPRPKNPRGSQRTTHPPKERSYPTRAPTYTVKRVEPLIPAPVVALEPSLCAPNLPYFVNRTKSNELPIYEKRKRGGDQLLTMVRKIDGKVEALRDELRAGLGLKAEDVVINPVTKHIHLKGHHKRSVQHYLWQRRF